LIPPVAFIIVLVSTLLLAAALSRLSFKGGKREADATKSYACGEDVPTNLIQPDYSVFFPFAFFFTILHVLALIVTTVPVARAGSFAIALTYLTGAVIALFVLFRK
jgi:NADH-quinone oxidoreductase subunit A